jgi:uncharacterized protein (TIGR03086 family)
VSRLRSAGYGPAVVDDLAAALTVFVGLATALSAEALADPSPCDGWTVGDVVAHVATVTEKFGRFAAGESSVRGRAGAGGIGPVAAGALEAWRANPGALERVCVLPFGSFDGATAAGINLFDVVVHGWDVATGAGVPYDLDPALAVVAYPVAVLLTAEPGGQFAPPVRPPAGAGPLVRLLALTGRAG